MIEHPPYESLREAVRAIPASARDEQRQVRWLEADGRLAVSRDADGRLELFLVGDPLEARSPTVRDAMRFDRWKASDGAPVAANRLVLPAGEEYDSATAVICVELLDRAFVSDAPAAFRDTEPVIELFLSRAASENAVLTGLAGELQLLAALVNVSGPGAASPLVASWQGWERSTRDFQIGSLGVEVKTTTTGASVHSIEGWYQVEPGVSADGTVETDLHLLSQGIRWLEPDADRGWSIESLMQGIARHLIDVERSAFVSRVRGYLGSDLDIDSEGRARQEGLRRPFVPVFERLYDLGDPVIKVPRSADLAHLGHMQLDSVRFDIQLPPQVRGDVNPVVGLQAIATVLRRAAHL